MTQLRSLAVVTVAVLSLVGCSRQRNARFAQEQDAISKALPSEARVISSVKAQTAGETTETSWTCEILTQSAVAKAAFQERVPHEYKPVRLGEQEFVYSKYDGHDEFDLTMTFNESTKDKTAVLVVLRSIPD